MLRPIKKSANFDLLSLFCQSKSILDWFVMGFIDRICGLGSMSTKRFEYEKHEPT